MPWKHFDFGKNYRRHALSPPPPGGGSRNSSRGGGFWAGILRGGGLGSRSAGIFIYWQAQQKNQPLRGGGLNPLIPPWIRHCPHPLRPTEIGAPAYIYWTFIFQLYGILGRKRQQQCRTLGTTTIPAWFASKQVSLGSPELYQLRNLSPSLRHSLFEESPFVWDGRLVSDRRPPPTCSSVGATAGGRRSIPPYTQLWWQPKKIKCFLPFYSLGVKGQTHLPPQLYNWQRRHWIDTLIVAVLLQKKV